MSEPLPSRKEALRLLVQSGCSRQVVRHCKAVATLAVEMAENCKKRGRKVNVQLVERGALLHDIGRSKTHTIDHVIEGAKVAAYLGLPRSIVAIIERHAGGGITRDEARRLGWPVKDYLPRTLEEKIVAYADKLIEGSGRVEIQRTIEKLSRELGRRHSAIERVRRLHEELSPLMEDLKLDAAGHGA